MSGFTSDSLSNLGAKMDSMGGMDPPFNLKRGERIMGALWSAIVALVVAAVVLMIVSRFNLGLSVSGFGAAIISAIVIAIVAAIFIWLFGVLGISIGGGLLGTLVLLIVAAVVLLVSGRFVPGLKVNGFAGAIVAAIAIAVVYWILVWLLGLFGIVI